MKKINVLATVFALLFLIFFTQLVSAQNSYSIRSIKTGAQVSNELIVKDTVSNKTLQTVKLPQSYKRTGLLYQTQGSKYLVFYYKSDVFKAHLNFIDTINHEIISKTDINPINVAFDEMKRTSHWFTSFSNDRKEFLISTGKGRKLKLLSIDMKTGTVKKSYKLGYGDTKLLQSHDGRFIWAEKINLRNKPIKIIDARTLTELNSIAVDSRFLEIQNIDHLLFLQHKIKLKKNSTTETHQIIVFDLLKNKTIYKFNSSYPTVIVNTQIKSEGIYLLGRSFGRKKHLMFHKIDADQNITDASPTTIDFKPSSATVAYLDEGLTLFATGDKQVMKMSVNDLSKHTIIDIPDQSDNAIINQSGDKMYYTQTNGSKVGLVDFTKGEFIGADSSGRGETKVGQFVASFLTMGLTAPTGIAILPTHGLKFSKNILMLSSNEKWLFALNLKTDDVTVFNAENLSSKHTIKTGKRSFQMIQGTSTPDQPVVILSHQMASFFSPDSGQLIKQIRFNKVINISDTAMTVSNNGKTKRISLVN